MNLGHTNILFDCFKITFWHKDAPDNYILCNKEPCKNVNETLMEEGMKIDYSS